MLKLRAFVRLLKPCSLIEPEPSANWPKVSYARLSEALEGELSDCAVDILTAIGSKLAQRLLQARRKVFHLPSSIPKAASPRP
jgi:hypothetical protein